MSYPRSMYPRSICPRARAPRVAKMLAAIMLFALLASCGSSADTTAEVGQESAAVAITAPIDSDESTAAAADDDSLEDADEDHDEEDRDAASTSDEPAGSDAAVQVANAGYLDSYTLIDDSFGTQVTVTVDGDTRTIGSNTLPNHETGDFPNSGNPNTISEQDSSWTLTTDPTYTGQVSIVRETGVALNGVKFEPGTAESTECSSGEAYRIEGLQDMFDLGMDFNNAHVQPTGEYHYHGVSELLVDAFASGEDLVLVGFAGDGHLMYYSKSSAYQSSYSLSTTERSGTDCAYRGTSVNLDGTSPDGTYVSDWVYTDGAGDLDECNGTTIGDEYAYVITEDYPYIPRCLMGESTEAAPDGAAPGGAPGGAQGGAPDLTDAAAALGVTEPELQDLLGGPPADVAGAALVLDMTEDELMAVLESFGVAPPAA